MNRFIRWYNQNRYRFWIVLIAIVIGYGIIQGLNNYYKDKKIEEKLSNDNINGSITTITSNYNYSVVTEKNIDDNAISDLKNTIENFFNYCNNGEIEQAYSLLSNDCKQKLYPNINSFKQKYIDIIFTEPKTYKCDLFISNGYTNTYRLEISKNMLALGKKDSMPIEEYWTVVYEDSQYKININGYIGKENINISKEQNGIEINILSKQVYMDYEIYTIQVKNNTNENIILNTKEDIKSMYLVDENDVEHIAFLNEIPDINLIIEGGMTKTLDIKFNRTYKSKIKINKIIFKNIKIGQNDNIINVDIDI